MIEVYYTMQEGRRNRNGHTTKRGTVYKVNPDTNTLDNIGEYAHTSGGAGIELSLLSVCINAGMDVNGGYYSKWRDAIQFIEL